MKNTQINRTRLLEAPVARTLLQMALPMVFGILSMVVFNLADTFFVGRLGKQQLAALSFTFPVVLTISSLAQGIGMGASAVVSRAIGSENYQRVRRLATDSLILGLLVVGLGAAVGLLTIRPLFGLLGAKGVVLDYIGEYMGVWYYGMIFVVVPMVGNNIIRATGDAKTPGMVMVLGAAANLILDPLIIFGIGPFPALGIRGAALATLFGRGLTFLIAMYVLVVREKLLAYNLPKPSEVWRSWKEILHIGIPNAATKMIIPLGNGFITRVVASYGAAAVAGYGVASRMEFFSLAALNALSSVVGPFIGQNLGAGKLHRVKAGFTTSGHFSLYVGGFLFLVYLVLAGRIAAIFNTDPKVVATAALYMRIVSFAYAAQGFYLVVSAGLNVMKRPLQAAGLSVLEMFGLSVPLALLGSYLFGTVGVFVAIAFSYTVTGLVALWTIRRQLNATKAVLG
ncbi:MAG: MATE family efflux transporter [Spirochaetaceae bacterium]|nr:MATE family efflux transporter [Spirochaetaceae bacterium]MCF7947947.1 MATE family efflux transporter [Spirochaetia bacterium]MCF7952311.1 MATE family efflux transporter [Spirochaetaceae bacterium]